MAFSMVLAGIAKRGGDSMKFFLAAIKLEWSRVAETGLIKLRRSFLARSALNYCVIMSMKLLICLLSSGFILIRCEGLLPPFVCQLFR